MYPVLRKHTSLDWPKQGQCGKLVMPGPACADRQADGPRISLFASQEHRRNRELIGPRNPITLAKTRVGPFQIQEKPQKQLAAPKGRNRRLAKLSIKPAVFSPRENATCAPNRQQFPKRPTRDNQVRLSRMRQFYGGQILNLSFDLK
jgi:hypothetical protein